ncbi:MAG: hypothetical protein GY927_08075 [bacterium]|nr:hypothetical protein [bacterium]
MQPFRTTFQFFKGALIVFFALIAILFAPTGNAIAEEVDSLRIGGDYQFLTLRVGDDFRVCRRACKDDASCKAWTFIKERTKKKEGISFNLGPDLNIGFGGKREVIPPQCRLKHSVGPKHTNECCTSGVKQVVQRTRPNKAERCANYAESALEQQDKNLTQRCHFRGTRWQASYRNHYRWCMDSSRRSSVRETEVRDDKLRDCRDNRRVRRDRQCDRYASTAMDVIAQADTHNCRSSNREWDKEHERVYQWCLDNGRAKRRDVLERAQSKLASCIRRGGGARSERCENYAEDALEQVNRAKKNDCRARGTTWAGDFKTHYKECRNLNGRQMRAKTQLRKSFINRCIRRGSQPRIMETGSVEVRQRNARQWHSVRFSKRYRDPVVIMGPVSFNENEPAHARVRSVSSRGFEFRIEEFGKDGTHARESLSYMVIEKGIHDFGGTIIEAGTISTSADMVDRDWSPVRLFSRWSKAPIVLAQTQTFKSSDPVNARIKNVTSRQFEVTLSEKESDRRGHAREVVGYVAISQGRHRLDGGQANDVGVWSGRVSRANNKWRKIDFPNRFGSNPAVFARAQSSNGADTFDVRYQRLTSRRVELRLQEEQSKDRETNHTNEVLGVIAMPFGSYWATSSRSIDDQIAKERRPVPAPRPVDSSSGGGANLVDCRDYSRLAVAQFDRARRNSCGFIGTNWHGEANRHRRWCRRNGLRAADRFIVKHRNQLRNCLARADNQPVQESEWISIGCARVAFKKDRESFRLDRNKGRFSALMLKGGKARLSIYEVKVNYANRTSQVLSYRGKLGRGDSTGPLDLKGNKSFISKIVVTAKAKLSFPPKQGRLCVLGKR